MDHYLICHIVELYSLPAPRTTIGGLCAEVFVSLDIERFVFLVDGCFDGGGEEENAFNALLTPISYA